MAKKPQEKQLQVQSYPYDWLPAWGNVNSENYYPKRAFWNQLKAKFDMYENPDRTGKKIISVGEYFKTPEQLKWLFENCARTVRPNDNNRAIQLVHCTSFAFVLLDANDPDKKFSIAINCARGGEPAIEYTFTVHSKRLYMIRGDYASEFLRKMYTPALNTIGNNVDTINPMQNKYRIIPVEFLIPNPYDGLEWEKAQYIYRDGLKMGSPNGNTPPPMVESGKFEFYHKDYRPNEQFYGTYFFEKENVEVSTNNE